ncbi:MAG: DUF1295 domain-containing protein [Thermoanaerobaculia bacterium]
MSLTLLGWNVALVLALMTALWVVSIFLRDVSIVDPWWSIGFLLVSVHTVARTGLTPGKTLLLGMVATWAIRLWLHLLLRSRGKPEDPRYADFRRRFGPERYWWLSYFQVFLLQGLLILLISAPLQLAAAAATPDRVSWTDLLGLGIFTIGLGCEAVADVQLSAFRSKRSRSGAAEPKTVMDTGLWRFSRHPNYFGEAVLWWGFWLCAIDVPMGWLSVAAPALMTFLLVRVSGVTMLDAHLLATRPGYAEYIRRTSAFIPRRPRT